MSNFHLKQTDKNRRSGGGLAKNWSESWLRLGLAKRTGGFLTTQHKMVIGVSPVTIT